MDMARVRPWLYAAILCPVLTSESDPMAKLKIDPTKSTIQNLLDLVDSQNPSGPTIPAQVSISALQADSNAGNVDDNTSVVLTGTSTDGLTGFKGTVKIFYERLALDAEIALPATPVQIPNGTTDAPTILSLVEQHYGFVPGEISWQNFPDPGDSLPIDTVGTIQASGSLVYLDGTGSVDLSWQGLTYQQTVLADSPYAYYPLKDTSGTVATDISPNARHGTYESAAALATGALFGSGTPYAVLDGAAESYIDIAAAAAFCAGETWTAECWANVSSFAQHNLDNSNTGVTFLNNIANASPTNIPSAGFDWATFGSTFMLWQSASSGAGVQSSTGTVPAVDALMHVVMTYDNGALAMYLNGESLHTATGVVNATAEAGLQIGVPSWVGGAFVGTIGEVAVYNTALSADRVLSHFNAAQQ